MTGKLWEAYPANGDNYFKPKLWEHAEGLPLPAVGKFDEQFATAHTFDGGKMGHQRTGDQRFKPASQ